MSKSLFTDRLAIVLSGLCLLHCLALPFAVLLGPALSAWLLGTETEVHWVLFALAVPVSLWALSRGYQSHAQVSTLILGISGLITMLLGVSHVFGHEAEVLLTVVGVTAVLIAHVRNALLHRNEHSTET